MSHMKRSDIPRVCSKHGGILKARSKVAGMGATGFPPRSRNLKLNIKLNETF